MSEFFKTSRALNVISSRFPIGVETIYKLFMSIFIKKSKIILSIIYILFTFNSNLLSDENNKKLKIGLLAPLSGPHSEIGNSLLYSLQLALEEINDKNVTVVPRDSGFNNKEKLSLAINELRQLGIKVIIGPVTHDEFDQIKKFNDLIFISPSNVNPEFTNNIISIGVSLESQLIALTKFIKKQKKTKTIIMYPKNEYSEFIKKKLEKLNLNNIKTFNYSPNPEILTGEIEILTNYTQRKKSRIKKKNV